MRNKIIFAIVIGFSLLLSGCAGPQASIVARQAAICEGVQLASAVGQALTALATSAPQNNDEWKDWGRGLGLRFGLDSVKCAAGILVSLQTPASPDAGTPSPMALHQAGEAVHARRAMPVPSREAAQWLLDNPQEWK